MSLVNEELNQLSQYIDKVCVDCGRSYPGVVLNIEGHIHHGQPYKCINRKECERYKRKRK